MALQFVFTGAFTSKNPPHKERSHAASISISTTQDEGRWRERKREWILKYRNRKLKVYDKALEL